MTFGGMVSFGNYTFPTELAEFDDNFGDAVPKTSRLPGLDGGFSDDGDSPAQTAIGKVTVGFWLVPQTGRAGMDDLRDAVSAMMDYGLAKLTYQPTDSNDNARYCFARVNNIQMSENKDKHTDLHQKVRVIFQVPDPRWIYPAHESWTLGDGSQLGDVGLTIGGGSYSIAASGTSTSDTVTNNGNTTVMARISVYPGAGNSCQNPTIQRIEDGYVQDEVVYTGTLGATNYLVIDPHRQTAVVDAVSVFGANFSYKTPQFLRLKSGSNTVKVLFANAGDQATVRLWYSDKWR